MSWNPPCCDNGSELTGYRVEWKLSADYWGEPGVTQAQATETSHTITGLAQASQYAVRVRALNSSGAGGASQETVASPSGTAPLLAEFENPPVSHTGSGHFDVRIAFSEAISNSYIAIRDVSLDVTGGLVLTAQRLAGRNHVWQNQNRAERRRARDNRLAGRRRLQHLDRHLHICRNEACQPAPVDGPRALAGC